MPKEKRTLPKECEGQLGPKESELKRPRSRWFALHQAQMVPVPTSMYENEEIEVQKTVDKRCSVSAVKMPDDQSHRLSKSLSMFC